MNPQQPLPVPPPGLPGQPPAAQSSADHEGGIPLSAFASPTPPVPEQPAAVIAPQASAPQSTPIPSPMQSVVPAAPPVVSSPAAPQVPPVTSIEPMHASANTERLQAVSRLYALNLFLYIALCVLAALVLFGGWKLYQHLGSGGGF